MKALCGCGACLPSVPGLRPGNRESRSVYLAFLSPRIRVRHWGDEGQGKGAEALAAGSSRRGADASEAQFAERLQEFGDGDGDSGKDRRAPTSW